MRAEQRIQHQEYHHDWQTQAHGPPRRLQCQKDCGDADHNVYRAVTGIGQALHQSQGILHDIRPNGRRGHKAGYIKYVEALLLSQCALFRGIVDKQEQHTHCPVGGENRENVGPLDENQPNMERCKRNCGGR